jgi:Tol biopolymer transport system component
LNVIGLDGTHQRRLVEGAMFGRWSPDGTKIAYVGGEPPAVAVFVMSADGAGKEQLTD